MTSKWLFPLLAALATLPASLLAWRRLGRPQHAIDDAQIFLTYAQNFAAGEGFVYTRGGERVEGFTSLLWELVCAAAVRFSDQPELALAALSLLLAAGAVAATAYAALHRISPSDASSSGSESAAWTTAIVAGWCALSAGFVIWTTLTLMDTALWCFVLTLGTLAFAHACTGAATRWNSLVLVIAVVVAIITRPESLLIGLVWIDALAMALLVQGHGWRATWRAIAPPVVAYVATIGLVTAFRLAYFGYPLPNTYYAKVSPDLLYNLKTGASYLGHFLADQPLAAVPIVLAALVCGTAILQLIRPQRRSETTTLDFVGEWPPLFVVSSVVLAALASPVLAGGDHFEMHRFFQPVWPLLVLVPILFVRYLLGLVGSSPHTWAKLLRMLGAAMLATIAASQLNAWSKLESEDGLRSEFHIAEQGRSLGDQLNKSFSTSGLPSIGVITAGGVGRTYRGPVIDLMGLNNLAMGHSNGDRQGFKNHAAFDPAIFYELAPDLVAPSLEPATRARERYGPKPRAWLQQVLRGVLNEPRFRDQYVAILVAIDSESASEELVLAAYCKRELLDKLRQDGVRFTLIE